MSDPVTDEIDNAVDRASTKRRRIVKAKGDAPRAEPRGVDVDEDEREDRDPVDDEDRNPIEDIPVPSARRTPEPRQRTMEEMNMVDLLPKGFPKPSENVKTLGDLNAKYSIGDLPDFKLQVWRLYPKLFPGGGKADGFYDTWEQALSEEMLQNEYGGGVYLIVVVGPNPDKRNYQKRYDSLQIQFPGEAKASRLPRAMQNKELLAPVDQPQPMMSMGQENPKLAETAMKLAVDMADKEREERHRMEDKAGDAIANARSMFGPLIESHKNRADDLVRAEREKADAERAHMTERFAEERAERGRLEARLEQVMQEVSMQRTSAASELRELIPLLGPRGDEGKGAERMLESVLSKHQSEMEAMRSQNQQTIELVNKQHADALTSMRAAHQIEIQAQRESAQREIQSERDSGRRREERVEDQLKMEREERRRDQDRARELLAERDLAWKDRLETQKASLDQSWEMQKASIEQSWEARHQSVVASYENRGLWQQQEIDRTKAEMLDVRARMTDSSDPIAIVHKAKEIREAIGGPDHPTAQTSGSGGIGMGGEDWRSILAEGAAERLPAILQAVGNMLAPGAAAQQGQQQAPAVGSIVQTPQGEMVVVPAPNMPGGVALAPRAAVEAQMREQQGDRMLPSGQRQGGRQRVMPEAGDMPPRRKPSVSVVQNLNVGFPKKIPPWEGGGDNGEPQEQEQPRQRTRQSAPRQPQPARTSRPAQQQAPAQQAPAGRPASHIEKQGLRVVAKLVHDSVMNADEPEEFVAKIMKEWNPEVLKRIVGEYSIEEIASNVAQAAPNGAGATPEGQKFMQAAFSRLKNALG